ncbi:MAG: hypothetical protein GC190_20865 [Alphaproteobacteria bacterium]|nr:hypothetical protein [Alphaproteobacteria bacterium]
MGAGFLAFVAILAVIYFAVRGRAERLREQMQDLLRRANERSASNRLPTESMIKCPTCGTYSAPGQQRACDRADCPYR